MSYMKQMSVVNARWMLVRLWSYIIREVFIYGASGVQFIYGCMLSVGEGKREFCAQMCGDVCIIG
jgi:hypothetical protein